MKPNLNLLLIFFVTFPMALYARQPFRIMFYNVENLFDTVDHPETADEEFTPEGTRHWTPFRYYKKINHIAKVISSVGEWDYPAFIGLCEIENEKVLNDLTRNSLLKSAQYRYILTESPDIRGIDVALLYQRGRLKYLYHESIRLYFPENPEKKTRDVLHVTGQIITEDTLDIFICHFPSRRGGELGTEKDRLYAASVVKAKTDSLFRNRTNAHIIIMGDFNDEPSNKSISKTLDANPIGHLSHPLQLYNLFLSLEKESKTGSYKYQDDWNFLDQIIVSGSLLDKEQAIHAVDGSGSIFQANYLFTPDITRKGKRPKKTYHGYKYEGGYSDHLPVYMDFFIKD